MILSHANIFLAPIAGLVIIMVDCHKKRSADGVSKLLLMLTIGFTLAHIASELLFDILNARRSSEFTIGMSWAANTFYFMSQSLAFGFMVLLLVYITRGDKSNLRTRFYFVAAVWCVNLTMLIANLFTGKIFTVTREVLYARGELFSVQIILFYFMLLILIVDTFVYRKQITGEIFALLLVSVAPSAIGSLFDMLDTDLRMTQPSFFVSLLFAYLFIVRRMTLIDNLTGANNRRSCDEFLSSISKSARRKDYSFIMADMDKFKEINDTYGHAQGDEALKDAAEVLRASVRKFDLVARYGGDEFIIIAATKETDVILSHITEGLKNFNAKKTRPYQLSISCGGGLYAPDDPRTPMEFMEHVDGLMYAKKTERRR